MVFSFAEGILYPFLGILFTVEFGKSANFNR